MFKKLMITLVAVLMIHGLRAQSFEVIPPAPEAAKIAEFGITPTNLYSGRQNLSIPIHSINFDGMSLPITASYYSGGVRANEEAGDIGLGWVINASASISRVIMNRDDLMNTNLWKGYVHDTKEVPIVNDLPNFIYTQEYSYLLQTLADTEPDIWTINFFGTTTKFILSKKTAETDPILVKKLTADPSRITYDESTNTFEVTNENGFKGIFDVKGLSTATGGSTQSSDRFEACKSGRVDFNQSKVSILNNGRYRAQTTWYLSKIISPKGNEVTYTYDLDPVSGESRYISVSAPSFGEIDFSLVTNADYSNSVLTDPHSCSQLLNEHVYLSTIESDDLIITFEKTNREDVREVETHYGGFEHYLQNTAPFDQLTPLPAQRFTAINIDSKDGVLSMRTEFQHSYFNADATTDPTHYKRLRLDGITVDDQQYRFDYFDGLPNKTTLGIDYWGYYNGNDSNQKLIPPFTPSPCLDQLSGLRESREFYVQHENRKANFDFGKAGLLHTVHYPTGGYTKYDYEGHEYLITSTEEAPVDRGFYSVTAVESDNESEEFTYSGHFSQGGNCQIGIKIDLSLQYKDYWEESCCSDRVSASDLNKNAIELINVDDNSVTALTSWSFLYHEADIDLEPDSDGVPNFYSKSITLDLPPGTYKIRVKRVDDAQGNMRYYAWARASVVPLCDLSPLPPGEAVINQVAGGARIKRITSFDELGQAVETRSFKYKLTNPGHSSTSQESSGLLMTPIRTVYIYNQAGVPDCSYHLVSHSETTMSNAAQGNFIGYSTVHEIYDNISNQERGRIIYDYQNEPLQLKSWGFTAEQYDNFNGALLSSNEYDQQQLIRKSVNYHKNRQRLDRVVALKYIYDIQIDPQSGVAGGRLRFSHNYDLLSEFITPRQIVSKEYFDYDVIEQDQELEFNTDFLLRKRISTDSEGDVITEEYKRASDYNNPAPALQAMKEQHLVAPAIEQLHSVNGWVTNGSATKFGEENGIIVPEELYSYNTKGAYFSADNGANFSASFDLRAKNKFDDYGNLIENVAANGTVTSYIWGYDHDYPVAQIVGLSIAQISSIAGIGPNYHAGNGALPSSKRALIENEFPAAQVSTFTFIRGVGISTATDANNLTSSYSYDNQGRLLEIRDHENNLITSYDYNYTNDNN